MKDMKELQDRFAQIPDMAVSEEMLGAYIEGNLNELDALQVEMVINDDFSLNDICDEIKSDDTDFPLFGLNQIEDFDNIELPNIDNMNMNDNYDDLLGLKIFGEPGSNDGTEYNPLINQFYPDTCAIRSQQIILRDYGIDISQEQLIQIANEHGWYAPGQGTPMGYVGELLNIAGVHCHQSDGNTIYDLTNELAQGHRVIVGVDSGELWAKGFLDKLGEKLEDMTGLSGADHALIVAGVEVNPNDHNDVKVVLTDPGSGQLRIEYTLEEFMDAWKDSNCFMVSTETPAPYQFDPATNMEVPSGFYSDFCYNNFIVDNGYQLSPDNFTIPDNYIACYSEESPLHFDMNDAEYGTNAHFGTDDYSHPLDDMEDVNMDLFA